MYAQRKCPKCKKKKKKKKKKKHLQTYIQSSNIKFDDILRGNEMRVLVLGDQGGNSVQKCKLPLCYSIGSFSGCQHS
ncbi:hypothetical protein HOLleu_44065 [Holothuria leucospilota]|uniref:Uncharacterized protein n=1 Tax=Holothuria leucospilota TaxID=206669 RepID=A0A9Q0YD26_HOLLE|nr:hypothetical protein HOLleu_44065 [Holothuria leucospilota]